VLIASHDHTLVERMQKRTIVLQKVAHEWQQTRLTQLTQTTN
jgi:ABC-type ATPase involved in cell division